MAEIARGRGIEVCRGTAEQLPFENGTFDFALMGAAICFFKDVPRAFREAHRVTRKEGFLIIAKIDRESALGRACQKKQKDNVFYGSASFYTVPQVTEWLCKAGFEPPSVCRAVFENGVRGVKQGCGEGGFVVLKAQKQSK